MLGQHDLITYEEPPSAIARRTFEVLRAAIARRTIRFTTAMFPESATGNGRLQFDSKFQSYLNLKGK